MSVFPFNITNPGFDLGGILTSSEAGFVTALYAAGSSASENEVLMWKSGAPSWETLAAGSGDVGSGPSSSALTLDTWNHVVGRRRASDYYPVITLNNTHTVGSSGDGTAFTANNNNAFVNRRYNSSYSSSQRYATGYWSEMRIRASDPGDNWITTEYNNQSDEAGFWGTWSDVGGGANTTNFFLMM